ncbi:MAG: hypothetical protein IMZ55_17965, partial [Acidobacteria bacterium]|nr:hypothetical protein [Acidobacteriota bacterium]
DKPLGTDGAGAATEYRLRRWTSSDLVTWSPEEAAGTFKVEGTFPTDRLYALDGEGGPAILGFGASWEKTWDLGLIEPGPDGKWCVAGRLWGLLPGTARPVYHPRWGYLLAAVSAESHEWWPQDPSGPFVLRGPDLKPLREWRNPLPPLAGRTEATPEKKTELADKMAPQVHLGADALGKPFNAIRDFWESPRASKVPVGELAYVYAFAPRSHALEGSQHFRPPAPNRGTVHPKARVVAIDLGGQRVAVALDAEKADAKYYDVLRLDLTGKGDFRDALQVPRIYLRPQPGAPGQGTAEYEFAAAFPAMPVGPRRVGAGIVIGYEEGAALGSATKLWYGFSTCAVGECRFGDKVYKVRFRDHTGNLSVRDTQGPDRAEGYAGRRIKGRYGDWFCVDCYEDGDKVRWASNIRGDPILYGDREWHINEQCIPQALYGQPVLVDGRWWDVRVTEDGGHVAAEPSTGPMAQIQLDHPFWRLILIGPSAVLHVQGGKEPVPVPAGRYEVYCYDEYLAPTPNYASNVLDVTTWTEQAGRRNGMTLDLKAGTTTPVRLGSPLRATIVVTKEPGALCFRIDLKDTAGRGASLSSLLHGKAPTRFLLTGGSGERAAVFEATSLYEAVRRGWKIPAGFRGTYTVTAEFPGNFPIESEPVTVTVP